MENLDHLLKPNVHMNLDKIQLLISRSGVGTDSAFLKVPR